MELYRLRFVLRDPSDETEGKYLAEIRAQALESLQGVATAFIESYRDRGEPLPEKVEAAIVDAQQHEGLGEVMVAV